MSTSHSMYHILSRTSKCPQSNCHTLNIHCIVQRSNLCYPQQLVKKGPVTSWFPHESCWRRHRCRDQLPWSSGKIQYLLLLPVGRCRQHWRKLGKNQTQHAQHLSKTHCYELSENCYLCFWLLIYCIRVFMIFIHVPFHPGTLDDISMIARYVLKFTTMQSIKQAFSNQTKL